MRTYLIVAAILFGTPAFAQSPPVFSGISPATPGTDPIVQGNASGASFVQLYTDAACSAAFQAAEPVSEGTFAVVFPASTPAVTFYARAFDAGGNPSDCTARGIPYHPVHAAECPSLPGDAPISRPPAYAIYTGVDRLLTWKDQCDGDLMSCPPGSDVDDYFEEIVTDQPEIHGVGGFAGLMPIVYGLGAVRGQFCYKACAAGCTSCSVSANGTPICASDCPTCPEICENTGPNGTPTFVYGTNVFQGLHSTLIAGVATPAEITLRMSELQQYHAGFGATEFFTYSDLGSQIMGNHVTHTGLWDFCENYLEGFITAGFPVDILCTPTAWLLKLWNAGLQHPSYPPELAGYSFLYAPVKAGYDGLYRYAANLLDRSFLDWQSKTIELAASAGFRRLFFDNVFFGRCWNDECEAAFATWLNHTYGAPEADRLFSRPPPSMFCYYDFEDWIRNQDTPWQYLVPGQEWAGGTTDGGAWIRPDLASSRGAYAGKIVSPSADGGLQLLTRPDSPAGAYTFTFQYRTSATAQARVKVYRDPNAPFVELVLPPSTAWTTAFASFSTADEGDIATRFDFDTRGTLWLDDLILAPDGPVEISECMDSPSWHGRLHAPERHTYNGHRPRQTASTQFYDSVVDLVLPRLRAAGRAVNPDFDLFINSVGRQRRGADWYMIERFSDEASAMMWDQGWQPGLYAAGTQFPIPTSTTVKHVLAAPQAFDNIFLQRHVAALRYTDEFARPLHHARSLGAAALQNVDTVLLQLAEGASFGGGVGIDPGLGLDYPYYVDSSSITGCLGDECIFGEIRGALRQQIRDFFDFTNEHSDLYACLEYAAEIGVVYRSEAPITAGNPNGNMETIALIGALAEQGLLVDLLGPKEITSAQLDRLRVLVLNRVHRLSEAEAAAILAFAAGGGIVISTYDTGLLDELGRFRDAYPSTVWSPPALSNFWVLPGSITADDVTLAITTFVRETPTAFPSAPDEHLRIATWSSWNRTVVHVLDYGVPRGKNAAGQAPIHPNLEVAVPWPSGAAAPLQATIRALDFSGVVTVPVTLGGDGRVNFTIPAHHIYSVVVLE